MLFAWITDPNAWLALGTLTLLEIVLGIDNIIFLSLVVAKLPTAQRNHARRIGLAAAMIIASGTAGLYRLGNASDKPAIRSVWRGNISARPDPSTRGIVPDLESQ